MCTDCCAKPSSSFSAHSFERLSFHLTFLLVKPADAAAIVMWLEEQLSEELPQVDRLAGVVTHHT